MQHRSINNVGLALALVSGATFGTSGSFASSLLSAGWSPGAAVTARVCIAALVLTVPALLQLRSVRVSARGLPSIVLYGIVAVAGLPAVLLQRRAAPVRGGCAAARVLRDSARHRLDVGDPRAPSAAADVDRRPGRSGRPRSRARPGRRAQGRPRRRPVGARCSRRPRRLLRALVRHRGRAAAARRGLGRPCRRCRGARGGDRSRVRCRCTRPAPT